MKKLFRTQIGFFLYGFAFWFPIAIFIFVLSLLFNNVEDVGRRLFLLFLNVNIYETGYGSLLFIILLYISGVILKIIKVRKYLSKLPIIGLFFGGGEVITVERLARMTPCLIMMSPTCLSYGWVLSEEKVDVLKSHASFTLIHVYYPNVPTLITGQVFPIRKESVIKLGNPSKEIIDLLLYAFRSPESIKYLPWEDETVEEFSNRAQNFGIRIAPSTLNNDNSMSAPPPVKDYPP